MSTVEKWKMIWLLKERKKIRKSKEKENYERQRNEKKLTNTERVKGEPDINSTSVYD